MAAPGVVRIGTSGWIYRHWRGVFYPERLAVKNWFDFYRTVFDTVEINNTFYRLPAPAVFTAWRDQAPAGFLYAVKASRYLTHFKKLHDPDAGLESLLGRARLLGPHLGPILFQLPPRWHCDPAVLRHFLSRLPRDLRHVFEFRDPSWYTDEVRALLTEYGAGFCIHDLRGGHCPIWTTSKLVYTRFHGPTETAYAGSYPRARLEEWAERIRSLRGSGHDVFAYFNNDQGGHAVTNARTLRGLLGIEPRAGP